MTAPTGRARVIRNLVPVAAAAEDQDTVSALFISVDGRRMAYRGGLDFVDSLV